MKQRLLLNGRGATEGVNSSGHRCFPGESCVYPETSERMKWMEPSEDVVGRRLGGNDECSEQREQKIQRHREWLYTHTAQGLGEARREEGSPGHAGCLDWTTTRALKNFKSGTQLDN